MTRTVYPDGLQTVMVASGDKTLSIEVYVQDIHLTDEHRTFGGLLRPRFAGRADVGNYSYVWCRGTGPTLEDAWANHEPWFVDFEKCRAMQKREG